MSLNLILFIIIHLGALGFFMEMLRRVSNRTEEFHLTDTRQTVPFGFVRLRHIVVLYILLYILWMALSIYLYFNFLTPQTPGLPGSEAVNAAEEVLLEL